MLDLQMDYIKSNSFQDLTDKKDDKTEMKKFLSSLNLAQYYETFEKEGFDTLDILSFATEQDFNIMKVKRGHKRLLMNHFIQN